MTIEWEHYLNKDMVKKTMLYFVMAMIGALVSIVLLPYMSKERQENQKAAIDAIAQKESHQYNIADVIRSVKHEMLRTQNLMVEAEEKPMFQLERFDLELKFIVQNQLRGDVKFELPELLIISDQSMVGSEKVQTIHLEFSIEKGKIYESPVLPFPSELDDASINKSNRQ